MQWCHVGSLTYLEQFENFLLTRIITGLSHNFHAKTQTSLQSTQAESAFVLHGSQASAHIQYDHYMLRALMQSSHLHPFILQIYLFTIPSACDHFLMPFWTISQTLKWKLLNINKIYFVISPLYYQFHLAMKYLAI